MTSQQHRYLFAAFLRGVLLCGQASGGLSGDGNLDLSGSDYFPQDTRGGNKNERTTILCLCH